MTEIQTHTETQKHCIHFSVYCHIKHTHDVTPLICVFAYVLGESFQTPFQSASSVSVFFVRRCALCLNSSRNPYRVSVFSQSPGAEL